jgi:parvulin-like peptidyl-prolyl isomerase
MTGKYKLQQNAATALILVAMGNWAFAQTPKPAAVVNGTAITVAEVEAVLKQASPSATPLTEMQKKQMRMEALGMLIDDQLMEQFLRKNGPHIGPDEVNRRFAELEAAQKKQGKTMEAFYKETGQNEVQLRINLLNMIQWANYVKEHLTEADVKRFYDESRDFFDRVSVRASHIVIRIQRAAPENEKQVVRAKLQEIRQQIVSGAVDFAQAAKKHSQDSTAPSGGDIGFFPRKFAVDESFAQAAFALKPGEVSQIVETDYGMHLIKVTERKPGLTSDYTKIKEEVREFCIEEMRLHLLNDQRKAAKVEINMQ